MAQIKLTTLIQKIQDDLHKVRNEFLLKMAEDVVTSSILTVDTGAYITSHSIRTTRGAGRSRSSHGKPTGQDPEAKAAEAMDQLMSDIASLPDDQTQVYLTNNSPHANIVEYSHGYAVYSGVRSRAKYHLEKAINEVKGGR
mgnify:CR=1 FL=1|jgi:hypothetical protein